MSATMRPQKDKGPKGAPAAEDKTTKAAALPSAVVPPEPLPPIAPLFRRVDWFTFSITTLLVFIGYWWTLAPDMTCEDSGELAVASMYAGVPHPPGYPVWTIYSWLFTKLFPISNIAYRVGHELRFDGKSETFVNDRKADALLTREYRKGFEIPKTT